MVTLITLNTNLTIMGYFRNLNFSANSLERNFYEVIDPKSLEHNFLKTYINFIISRCYVDCPINRMTYVCIP